MNLFLACWYIRRQSLWLNDCPQNFPSCPRSLYNLSGPAIIFLAILPSTGGGLLTKHVSFFPEKFIMKMKLSPLLEETALDAAKKVSHHYEILYLNRKPTLMNLKHKEVVFEV